MNASPPLRDASAESAPRFRFGRNWQRFRAGLNPQRLAQAEASLDWFWPANKHTVSFLDVGSGSGLFSLVARQRGARVHSFDYDADSVACTVALKQQFRPDDPDWTVEQGSVLDRNYLASLGRFDVVYSWGVLHHTGALQEALENVRIPLAPGGRLVIAIYNDQGWKSRLWTLVKKVYCSGLAGRALTSALFVPAFLLAFLLGDLARGRNPLARYRSTFDGRGMSVVTDIIDWIGGYPFEVARPDWIQKFYEDRGLFLISRKTTRGLGCNEFVFGLNDASPAPRGEPRP